MDHGLFECPVDFREMARQDCHHLARWGSGYFGSRKSCGSYHRLHDGAPPGLDTTVTDHWLLTTDH